MPAQRSAWPAATAVGVARRTRRNFVWSAKAGPFVAERLRHPERGLRVFGLIAGSRWPASFTWEDPGRIWPPLVEDAAPEIRELARRLVELLERPASCLQRPLARLGARNHEPRTKMTSVTEMQALTRAHPRYHLSFRFRGLRRVFTYGVDEAEHDRFEAFFRCWTEASPKPFFVFTSRDGHELVVAVRHLLHAHALWDAAIVEQAEELEGERNKSREYVRIFMAGTRRSLRLGTADPSEVFAAYLELDSMEAALGFIGWHDEDGELVVVNTRHILLAEIPSGMVIAGHAETDGDGRDQRAKRQTRTKTPRSRASQRPR